MPRSSRPSPPSSTGRPTGEVDAERSYLAELGGGCTLPAGANAVADGDGSLTLTAILASPDGRILLRHSAPGSRHDAEGLGRRVAAYLLDDAGGRSLLAT